MEPDISTSLKSRVLKGASFLLSGYALGQIFRLGANLITTRLLVPEYFGIMAIVQTVLIGLELMSDMGIQQSIVRSQNAEKISFRRTAWVFQIGRSLILACLCVLLAAGLSFAQYVELISKDIVYGDANLPIALYIIAISVAIHGFRSIDLFMAERRLEFARFSLFELLSQVNTVAAIIVWALFDPTIYALAGGTVVGQIGNLILSHVLFPSTANRFGWDRKSASELFHFGKWLLLSSTLGFITSQGDRIIFGLIMSTADLGRYAVAIALKEAVKMIFIKLRQVWLPLLSETVREQPEKISDYYYKIRKFQDMLIFTCAGFLITTGDLIIDVLYDDRYQAAGWMLQLMSVSIIFIAYDTKSTLMLAEGRSKLFSFMMALRASAMIIGVPLFYEFYGLVGALLMAASVEMFGNIVAFKYFHNKGILKPLKEVMYVFFIFVGVLLGLFVKYLYSLIFIP